VGAGVAGSSLLGGRATPAPAPVAVTPLVLPAAAPKSFSVFVRDIRFTAPDLKPGIRPEPGVLYSPHGEIEDEVGELVGTLSGGMLPGSAGRIGIQQLTFTDGTLIGMGSGSLDNAEYAVVGGTGRFAGASGSYSTKLQPGTRGRDAEFVINVSVGKG
jgi:hypothetical protein